MVTVTSFCYKFSLRTGTLIILGIWTALSAYNVISDVWINFHVGILYILMGILPVATPLVVSILGIYGVIRRRPGLLIPFLVLLVYSIGLMMIVMNILPLTGKLLFSITPAKYDEGKVQFGWGVIGAQCFISIALGIHFYAFIVVRSFYLYKEPQKKANA